MTNISFEKILKEIKLGNSFRAFGGFGLLISIWVNNTLALKLSLITFIFGGLARAIEILNNIHSDKKYLIFLTWLLFLILYSLSINQQINILFPQS